MLGRARQPPQQQNRVRYVRWDVSDPPQTLPQKTLTQTWDFLGFGARPRSRAIRTLHGYLQADHAGIALGMHECAFVHPPTSGWVA